ncbi:TcfC E-set like domain-containing protein [Photobacterium damselae]|uniref:TcfC E-set like domain-containing protein n=1 Tax=Photobacterium damselae TaxID=38293 RepID=UPI0035A94296
MNKICFITFVITASIANATSVYASEQIDNNHNENYELVLNNMKPLDTTADRKIKELLSYNDKTIKFVAVGTEDIHPPINIKAKVSYYSVFIDDESKSFISDYLLSIGIIKRDIKKILDVISKKIIHDNDCKGERSTCILINDKLKFVNDYYGNTLRMFIPSSYFIFDKSSPIYLKANDGFNQLVSNIYASYDGNTSAKDNYFLTADNYLGLNFGYVNLNGIINSYYNKINSFEFIRDVNEYTLSLGYSEQDNGFYPAKKDSFFANHDFVGLTFGKSNNLLVNDSESKQLSFFSPSSGSIEIFKNNEIIFQGYINSGYQSIKYSSLPLGTYDVDIVVKNNGNIIFNSKGFVSNINRITNNQSMPYFRVGKIGLSNDGIDNYNEYKDLFEFGITYPLFDSLSTVANGYFIDSKAFYTIGLDYYGERLYSNIKYTHSKNFNQSKLFIGYSYFSFQIDDYNNSEYYFHSRLQSSISINLPLTDKYSIYGNGFYSKDKTSDLSTHSYSIGGNFRSNSNVNISVDYTIQDDNNKIGLNISIPLWNDITYSSSLSLLHDRQINNYLNYDKRFNDTVSANLMVGHNYFKEQNGDTDNNVSITGSLSQFNDYYRGSLRLGKDTDNTNYGFTVNTTQLINRKGFFYTSLDNVKSSILIDNKNETERSIGDVQLSDKGQQRYAQYDIDDRTMIYLGGYKQQLIKYHFNEDNQFVLDDSFMKKNTIDLSPGKVAIIDVNVVDVSQVLVITPGLKMTDIHCNDTNCLSVQEINKGVFKVLIKPNTETNIFLGNNTCWSGTLNRNENTVAICENKL